MKFKKNLNSGREYRSLGTLLSIMKPRNLKPPFSWQNRRPLFEDRILYVPTYFSDHHLFGKIDFSSHRYFDNHHPIHVEFCSGNGLWILERALSYPHINWIAVEKRFDRVQKIWAKIKNYDLKNLIIVCGKAEDFLTHYVPGSIFNKVFINFPDPWPKDKHAKNRIIKPPFIQDLSDVCVLDAEAMFVTDHEKYSIEMIDLMQGSGLWKSSLCDPFYLTQWDNYGTSFFEALFQTKGQTIRYMQFLNTK